MYILKGILKRTNEFTSFQGVLRYYSNEDRMKIWMSSEMVGMIRLCRTFDPFHYILVTRFADALAHASRNQFVAIYGPLEE